MSTEISSFLPLVSPEVIGCPDILSKSKVVEAVIELCSRASVWKYEVSDFDTVASTRDYTITTPADTVVSKILSVNLGDSPLLPKSDDGLRSLYSNWRTETGDGKYYTSITDGDISIIPIPDSVKTLSLFVTLKPVATITTVEDFIFNNYATTIAKGAKYLLMSMLGTKWYNPQMAGYYQKEFYSEIGDINVKAQQGNVDAPLRAVANYSF